MTLSINETHHNGTKHNNTVIMLNDDILGVLALHSARALAVNIRICCKGLRGKNRRLTRPELHGRWRKKFDNTDARATRFSSSAADRRPRRKPRPLPNRRSSSATTSRHQWLSTRSSRPSSPQRKTSRCQFHKTFMSAI